MGRVCEHCGSDTYRSENFDRVRDRADRLQRRCDHLAREKGLLSAQLAFAAEDAADERAGLQRKVSRQARVIRRLEERIRALGKVPHDGIGPADASPVQQADAR